MSINIPVRIDPQEAINGARDAARQITSIFSQTAKGVRDQFGTPITQQINIPVTTNAKESSRAVQQLNKDSQRLTMR